MPPPPNDFSQKTEGKLRLQTGDVDLLDAAFFWFEHPVQPDAGHSVEPFLQIKSFGFPGHGRPHVEPQAVSGEQLLAVGKLDANGGHLFGPEVGFQDQAPARPLEVHPGENAAQQKAAQEERKGHKENVVGGIVGGRTDAQGEQNKQPTDQSGNDFMPLGRNHQLLEHPKKIPCPGLTREKSGVRPLDGNRAALGCRPRLHR